jgi:hypothetical protein
MLAFEWMVVHSHRYSHLLIISITLQNYIYIVIRFTEAVKLCYLEFSFFIVSTKECTLSCYVKAYSRPWMSEKFFLCQCNVSFLWMFIQLDVKYYMKLVLIAEFDEFKDFKNIFIFQNGYLHLPTYISSVKSYPRDPIWNQHHNLN